MKSLLRLLETILLQYILSYYDNVDKSLYTSAAIDGTYHLTSTPRRYYVWIQLV